MYKACLDTMHNPKIAWKASDSPGKLYTDDAQPQSNFLHQRMLQLQEMLLTILHKQSMCMPYAAPSCNIQAGHKCANAMCVLSSSVSKVNCVRMIGFTDFRV